MHCNICLGDDFHPSPGTAPAGAGRVAGSAWEPIGLSLCKSVAWRDKESMEHQLANSCVRQIRLDAGAVSDLLWQHEGPQDNTRSKAAEWTY